MFSFNLLFHLLINQSLSILVFYKYILEILLAFSISNSVLKFNKFVHFVFIEFECEFLLTLLMISI
jgi:hypothetical protein